MGAAFSAFEVEGVCGAMDEKLNCGVKTIVNGTSRKKIAESLGGLKRGNIETNGDLAGIGTLLAFVIPTGISLAMGIVILINLWLHHFNRKRDVGNLLSHAPRPPRRRGPRYHAPNKEFQPGEYRRTISQTICDWLEAILLATADSQIILAIALGVNFLFVGKCQFTMYHFQMGLTILEIACVNAVLAFTLLRHYWKAPLAAIIRLCGLGTVLYFLGVTLQILKVRSYAAERLPPDSRLDSLILLKAACFLDKDFKRLVFDNLTPKDFEAVGQLQYKGRRNPEWIIWFILTSFTCIVFVFRILFAIGGAVAGEGSSLRRKLGAARDGAFKAKTRLVYCSLTWIACLVITCFQAYYAFKLRDWAHDSGWMKGKTDSLANEERNVYGFGQLAALFAMGGLLTASLDRMEFRFSSILGREE